MLCGISDVYDAMRSQRAYQQSFPSDRVLAVLKRNDGVQFDQHLGAAEVNVVVLSPGLFGLGAAGLGAWKRQRVI